MHIHVGKRVQCSGASRERDRARDKERGKREKGRERERKRATVRESERQRERKRGRRGSKSAIARVQCMASILISARRAQDVRSSARRACPRCSAKLVHHIFETGYGNHNYNYNHYHNNTNNKNAKRKLHRGVAPKCRTPCVPTTYTTT